MNELIKHISNNETKEANAIINNALLDKIQTNLDVKKVEIASTIYNKSADVSVEETE